MAKLPRWTYLQDRDFNRTTIEMDDIVTCHTRPNVGLLPQMLQAGLKVINVGDAVRPRNLNAAVKEGALFGLSLDEHLLFNPNHAVLNDLPLDVQMQLGIPVK
jgi:hypothetical protein